MDVQQRNTLDAFERMLVFLTTDPLPVPLQQAPPNLNGEIQRLRDVITEANMQAMHQVSGQVQKLIQFRQHVRAVLREAHLLPIRKVGIVLGRLIPGMPRLMNIPEKFGSEKQLLVTAMAIARDIEPFQHHFIDRGFPCDFLTQLRDTIAAVEHGKRDYTDVLARKLGGAAGLNAALQTGRDIRKCLNEIVTRCCRADPVHGPATFDAWRQISRTHRIRQAQDAVLVASSPASDDITLQ